MQTKFEFLIDLVFSKHHRMAQCQASAFAIAAHTAVGQLRKYTNEPYWYHCYHVATMAAKFGLSHAAVKAAWLHDVVEDTSVTIEDLRCHFSNGVCDLVYELTDEPKDLVDGGMRRRNERIAIQINRLSKASYEAKCLKLIDRMCNLISVVKYDTKFGKLYLEESKQLYDALKSGNNLAICNLFEDVLMYCENQLNERN